MYREKRFAAFSLAVAASRELKYVDEYLFLNRDILSEEEKLLTAEIQALYEGLVVKLNALRVAQDKRFGESALSLEANARSQDT
jgi:hypothetical protein